MDALALIVAALGGGIVAALLTEWFRSRREYDEARLLVLAELATMSQLAQNVLDGRFSKEWFAAAGLHTAAWDTYRVRLVRRLSSDMDKFGRMNGLYASIAMFQANPQQGDVGGLKRSFDIAHTDMRELTLRPLWPPRAAISRR